MYNASQTLFGDNEERSANQLCLNKFWISENKQMVRSQFKNAQ